MAAVKADIACNLGRADLSAKMIARRQGVSASYIQKLFRAEHTTFSRHLLDLRLAKAFDALRRRSNDVRTVSAIAFEVGFGDLSYFNRAFRRRFGQTPSDIRASARRGA